MTVEPCAHPRHLRHRMREWSADHPQNTTAGRVTAYQCGPCRALFYADAAGAVLPPQAIDLERTAP